MKEIYERIELEMILFQSEDIITTSYEEDELIIIGP